MQPFSRWSVGVFDQPAAPASRRGVGPDHRHCQQHRRLPGKTVNPSTRVVFYPIL